MQNLIEEIDRYLALTGMKKTTFGFNAADDGKFYDRIANGGRCWPETVEKVREYMAKNPPQQRGAA